MVEFFKDILKERYEPVKTVYKIEASVPNSAVGKFKKCAISVKCKSRTNTQCDNSVCQKFACREHSAIVCESCANSAEFGKITVSKKPLYAYANKKAPRRCEISKCPKKSPILCSSIECKKSICKSHQRKICYDCQSAMSSGNINVFSVKSPKIYRKSL